MRKIVLLLILSSQMIFAQSKLPFVNPMIGTGGHGHTFPGAVLPFGMVQLSPDTRIDGSWDGCSGYHYSDQKIYGFTHTHLSGTGCSDWGDILLMPYIGPQSVDADVYSSQFKHQTEKASPGSYEVMLEDDAIKAELTVTPRVGIHRYTFRKTAEANVVLDLLHRDKVLECMISLPDSVTVTGWRYSKAWAENQKVFFAIRFSRAYKKREIANNGQFIVKYGKFKIQPESGVFTFDLSDGAPLLVKVAISSVSREGALKNLEAEAPHWDFEKYKTAAANTWENQLAKIDISETDKDRRTVFYTALYHACIHPSLNMDVDGQYRGRDDKPHKAVGFTNYTVFSLWDTYRALHPLMTIIEQKRTNDFIQSFLVQYQQAGRLPVWELSSNETDCMIGFHSVSVIADALSKGIKGFDTDLAFTAMKAASNYTGYGLPEFNQKLYLEVDDENESVSKTMEYCYDNWCIGQTANLLGKSDESALYFKRALGYRNLYDASTGNMRPRKNGNWLSPFYPSEINNHFTEGNSWQYSFYVPHDVNGLIELHDGNDAFEKKLDELFNTDQKVRGREQADVTGLIGQYAQGNEPSHHMAFLYDYVGKPEKASARVKQICNGFYKNGPDGLIGNEDCGQMSAWYILSSMGMYPVCPGDPRFILVMPQFKESTIHLENGKAFSIKAEHNTADVWIGLKTATHPIQRTELPFNEIEQGGKLEYVFGPSGSTSQLAAPRSTFNAQSFLAAPLIQAPSQVFRSNFQFSVTAIGPSEQKIYYTMDGTVPSTSSRTYSAPISLNETSVVKARTIAGNDSSAVTTAHFYKLKYDYDVQLITKPNPQYSADGPQTLIDGMPVESNWKKGNWLGYQTQNLEVVVDLKIKKKLQSVGLTCLQDTRSWIIYPVSVQLLGSNDGKKFVPMGEVMNDVNAQDYTTAVKEFKIESPDFKQYRYIKVIARQFGKLPDWHAGKGGDSFIFAAELNIQ